MTMQQGRSRLWFGILLFVSMGATGSFVQLVVADDAPFPRVLDDRYQIQLFAESPDIVTPIGMVCDDRGRLLVIESHTHFRPTDYDGPPADRIRVFEDSNGDGQADSVSTYWEGTRASMSLANYQGTIYLATRNEILRLMDDNRDGVADRAERIMHLDTPGDYPHNGLSGLCFDSQGKLIFGLGENLGAPYRVIGRDGTELHGGGEGGNIYQCHADGSHLEKIATGLWNPFGICQDSAGRIFAVENDPDGRPPCRLLHLAFGGDYGFQFRYGRSGKHPLQAWEGELPGTLSMVAGTGEAPSSVIPYDGDLWVTSWGDHQIERYRLVPHGATWTASNDIVAVGGETFRPVGFAMAPDGILYVSDWVDRSYELHRRGRIWRLTSRDTAGSATERKSPQLRTMEQRATTARARVDWEAAASTDPHIWQGAVWGLIQHGGTERTTKRWRSLTSPRQRLALLHAVRWIDSGKTTANREWIELALDDADPNIRFAAVRWIADQDWDEYQPQVLQQLERTDGNALLYRGAVAAAGWLEHGKPEWDEQILARIATDPRRPAELRGWALRLLPADANVKQATWLALLQDDAVDVRREAAWALVQSSNDDRSSLLTSVTRDASQATVVRAVGIVGLSRDLETHRQLLQQFTSQETPAEMRREATRSLSVDLATPQQGAGLAPHDQIDSWLHATNGPGDAESGRRLFFHAHGGRCYQCHRWNGQGSDVGPDLTDIGTRMTRRRVLESILVPTREVGPHYKAFELELKSGELLTGMSLGQFGGGDKEGFINSQGVFFEVNLGDLESRKMSPGTIMPEGLLDHFSADDVRNLLQFLGAAP